MAYVILGALIFWLGFAVAMQRGDIEALRRRVTALEQQVNRQ